MATEELRRGPTIGDDKVVAVGFCVLQLNGAVATSADPGIVASLTPWLPWAAIVLSLISFVATTKSNRATRRLAEDNQARPIPVIKIAVQQLGWTEDAAAGLHVEVEVRNQGGSPFSIESVQMVATDIFGCGPQESTYLLPLADKPIVPAFRPWRRSFWVPVAELWDRATIDDASWHDDAPTLGAAIRAEVGTSVRSERFASDEVRIRRRLPTSWRELVEALRSDSAWRKDKPGQA